MEKNAKKMARKLVTPGIQWLPHLSYCRAGLRSQKQPQLLLILKEPFLSLKNRKIEREGRQEGRNAEKSPWTSHTDYALSEQTIWQIGRKGSALREMNSSMLPSVQG